MCSRCIGEDDAPGSTDEQWHHVAATRSSAVLKLNRGEPSKLALIAEHQRCQQTLVYARCGHCKGTWKQNTGSRDELVTASGNTRVVRLTKEDKTY